MPTWLATQHLELADRELLAGGGLSSSGSLYGANSGPVMTSKKTSTYLVMALCESELATLKRPYLVPALNTLPNHLERELCQHFEQMLMSCECLQTL